MKRAGAALAGAGMTLTASMVQAAPLRVMSVDQCADQYVLALAPTATLALSPRADDPDAFMRAEAAGHRRVRPTLEAAVGFRPDVMVRYWGGEARLLTAMAGRGVTVVAIDDATDVEGVRANIRKVAAALDASERGSRLIARMDARLVSAARRAAARGATGERSSLYLTAGGFTAGPGTLIDSLFRTVGMVNLATRSGFGPVSVERIALEPPASFVFGFLDQVRADWRGAGRHPVVRRAAAGRVAASLPAAVLTCPAWFVADGAERLAVGLK